jgi:hypothetical protein
MINLKKTSLLIPLAVVAAALPAAAASAKTTTVRFYDKPFSITLIHADGTTVAHPTSAPVAGDKLDIYSEEYRGTRAHHDAKPVGSSHTVCTFTTADAEPTCTSDVELGNGMLSFTADKVVGGTRHYRGAKGNVTMTSTDDNDNSANLTLRLTL